MNKTKQLFLIILCALWLIACGGSEPEPAAEEANTADPTIAVTAEPTAEPTPEPTPEPAVDLNGYTPFESVEGGFRLMHPTDWLAEDFFGMAMLATSQEAMDLETISSGGMTLIMPITPEDLEGETLSDSIELGLAEMAADPETGEVTMVQEVTEITTASGVPGATAIASFDRPDGVNITAQLTILAQDAHVLTLISMTPSTDAADITPLFATIIDSAELFPPEIEATETNNDPNTVSETNSTAADLSNFVPFESTEASFRIAYPTGWTLEDFGKTVIFATDEAAIDVNRSPSGGMFVVTSVTPDDLPGDNIRQSLERALGQVAGDPDNSNVQLIQDVTEFTTVNELEAVTSVATFDRPDGVNMTIRMSIMTQNGQFITAMGMTHSTEAAVIMPIFDQMVQLIDLIPDSAESTNGPDLAEGSISSDLLSGTLVTQAPYGPINATSAGETAVYDLAAGQVNLIPLTVAENTIVDIAVRGINETDVVIDLLSDLDSPSLILGPIDYGFEAEELYDVGLEADGEYNLLVGGYDQQAGQFSVTITPKEIDSGNSGSGNVTTTAGSLTLGIDGPQTGSIVQGETAAWQFEGTEGSTISIIVESTSGTDMVFDVIQNDTGTSITNGPVDRQFTAPEAITDLVIPANGMYTIEIRGYDNEASDYILTATTIPGLEVITTSSGVVEFGEIIQGGFAYGESSVWTFEATAGDVVTISAQPLSDLDIVLDVQDSAGKSLTLGTVDSEMSGAAEIAAVTIQNTGTYAIILNGFALADGSYILAVIKQ